ncbi:LysR family transcriptional regulator [Myxococcus sp. Y35]|uniref:LysR family transcriptional regulator n=1 Tax=Pseudomyxococcus flavus TaxID=3115648 RepID=UPI003CE9DA5A
MDDRAGEPIDSAAAAGSGSIARASGKLGLAPSALSKRVIRMADGQGTSLLVRTACALPLTPEEAGGSARRTAERGGATAASLPPRRSAPPCRRPAAAG